MAWFAKHKWSHQKIEQGRESLAASVKELSADEGEVDNEWDENEKISASSTGSSILIPPVLHLQSRPLPAVRIETTRQMGAKRQAEQEARRQEAEAVLPGKRLGRSTKVRLQAVRPGARPEPTTERVPVAEPAEERANARPLSYPPDEQALVKRAESSAPSADEHAPTALLCGSGVIEEGRDDATVHNPRISAQSIVSVMLAGNPGPVVVHYISLQPRAGFTLHMSAPVSATTPFNYAVWLF